jgi:hypothetical protein
MPKILKTVWDRRGMKRQGGAKDNKITARIFDYTVLHRSKSVRAKCQKTLGIIG